VADINAGSKSQGTYRAALAAVIILSVLMAAAIIALALGFVRQYRLYQQDQAPAAVTGDAAASLQLAPGAHIVPASTDAGKLVLQVTTPAGSEVDIFDLATGKRTAQVKDGPK
jgi:hypothetical protein